MAPGRAMLGIGTGFTGRNTMGLPPVKLERMREYIEMCRKLLRGEEVMYREGKRERAIRFLHPNHGYINLKDPIPIHVAANGPRRSSSPASRRRMDHCALRPRPHPRRLQAYRNGRGARGAQA